MYLRVFPEVSFMLHYDRTRTWYWGDCASKLCWFCCDMFRVDAPRCSFNCACLSIWDDDANHIIWGESFRIINLQAPRFGDRLLILTSALDPIFFPVVSLCVCLNQSVSVGIDLDTFRVVSVCVCVYTLGLNGASPRQASGIFSSGPLNSESCLP